MQYQIFEDSHQPKLRTYSMQFCPDNVHSVLMTPLLLNVGTDVFSTSTDGVVYLWDIRKLIEPVESWPLQQKDTEMSLGGISLDFESTMVR